MVFQFFIFLANHAKTIEKKNHAYSITQYNILTDKNDTSEISIKYLKPFRQEILCKSNKNENGTKKLK